MPDPWGADRTDEEDDWGTNTPNGLPSPLVVPLPPTAPFPAKSSSAAAARRAAMQPYSLEVWAGLMDLSKGRDKVLKTLQYSLRTYLYILSLIASVRPLSKWFRANEKRSKLAVAGLSLTRKCLLLLNPLRPAAALLSPEPTSARQFLDHLIDLVGSLADDVFCLSRLGLISRKKGVAADRLANRILFVNSITGLYSQYLKSYQQMNEAEEREQDWRTRKLCCDLVTSSYDVFDLTWFREPVLCMSGLAGALISTTQLYTKQYNTLVKR